MASDQRYCVECGERRSGGGLRDALPRTAPVAAAPVARRRTFAATTNSSLILGILTLLIAMGVGVLIGRSGDDGNTKASATPQVVTVQTSGTGGASTTTAATAAGSAAATKAAKASAKKKKAARTSSASSTPKTDQQKTAAKNGVKLPPAVVKVGQSCPKGTAGCSGGKFTGDYFGGG